MYKKYEFDRKNRIIEDVLNNAPLFDNEYLLPSEEFRNRQKKVWDMLQKEGFDCGVVYSDEHYCGDVPYVAGNNNIVVEPIAAVLGVKGLFFIAGLESGLVAEQYCHRSGVVIRKVNILHVDPEGQTEVQGIFEEACGKKPEKIALLTTRGVFPLGLYNVLVKLVNRDNVIDISEKYYEIKYEKSDLEMKLISEACQISDTVIEGMLRILQPGMTEIQLAGWGYFLIHELGVDSLGFPIMVTSGINNKTIVGRPSNRVIKEGDIVHIGISPKRDGLCGAQRTSVVCVKNEKEVPQSFRLWMNFLESAYEYAVVVLNNMAANDLPGNQHEQAMIEFYKSKKSEMEIKSGLSLPDFALLKGYVTTHNSGYTECQEFYGALDSRFNRLMAKQMVLMIDVGLQGYLGTWNNELIPGLDYIVIEKTLGKFGKNIRVLNNMPVSLQYLVGEGFD